MNRRPRARNTRLSVRVGERVATILITAGGIGTIAAVALIFVFLVSVVFPLFARSEIQAADALPLEGGAEEAHLLVDEYRSLGALVHPDGSVTVLRLDTGALVDTIRVVDEAPSAWAFAPTGELAWGFADGTVRVGSMRFESSFPNDEELPEDLDLEIGETVELDGCLLQKTPEGIHRLQGFVYGFGEAYETGLETIERIDVSPLEDSSWVVAYGGAQLRLVRAEESVDLFTDEVTYDFRSWELPLEPGRGAPARVLVTALGDNVFVLRESGELSRLDLSNPNEPRVAEELDVVPEEGARVTAAAFMVGKTTLVVGDSEGRLRSWFRTKPEGAETSDGALLESPQSFPATGSPVESLTTSARSRVLLAGHADGRLRLFQATVGDQLAETTTREGEAPLTLALAPRDDGAYALLPGSVQAWDLDLHHPEAGAAAFFAPIWYEGYTSASHTWQSEGATDEFEPKLGFMPLVFGTLKATFYSMLFGAPLALLAALYTSEFLDRRLRSGVKSTIEMMASLPSVVLGFLAGLVVAPFAQSVLPATLVALFTVPLALLLGANLWQLLPEKRRIRWQGWQRFAFVSLALPIGIGAGALLGAPIEGVLFGGDVELWLDGQREGTLGGWTLLLLPLAAVVAIPLVGRIWQRWLGARSLGWDGRRTAWAQLGKLGAICAAALILAAGAGWLLGSTGVDPRGSLVDTYDSRNALVVGFVMGFAIIPIIYTLAEDALTSVPDHLRQASLGAGATTWQTAVRVVIPAAMSGLFSSVMIGFGRAIGETMIVLMATGNTPIMDLNIFNGFRTLAANIAFELPEAAKGTTHYRTLFFAALVLFGMTFCLNTLAEFVRARFRKRLTQL